jgi:hypothetical protein
VIIHHDQESNAKEDSIYSLQKEIMSIALLICKNETVLARQRAMARAVVIVQK